MMAQNGKYVNVFIGTDGTGHTFPGPSRPFGMVQPGPDTGEEDWNHTSGYQYQDTTVIGFSQTHLSGTGIGELGDVLMLPLCGTNDHQIIDKNTETASPGYYKIKKKDGVIVELTCTDRVALHRYTYPSSLASLLVDFQHGIRFQTDSLVLDSNVKIENDSTISGYCHTKNWVERRYAFCIKFNHCFTHCEILKRIQKENAPRYMFHFLLGGNNQLLAKIAISTTDVKGAKHNMKSELSGWNFDKIKEEAENDWNNYLQRIDIEADKKDKTIFYTSLYHLLLQPSNIADVDGKYRGADNKIHRSLSHEYYSTLSNWDVFRGAFPLLQILVPEKINAIVNSMIDHCKVSGLLPIWTAWGQDNYCMIGNHAIPMIASAWKNGFRGFNQKDALDAMVVTSTRPHIHSQWDVSEKYGYYPYDIVKDESVSKLLENCYDDWCVGNFASEINEKEIAKKFLDRSRLYRNIFDQSTELFRSKDSHQHWRSPFDPFKATSPLNNPGDYTEANAWQYFWTTSMYDIDGVKSLLGDENVFTEHLDKFFTTETDSHDKYLGQEAMIGQYAHGNEPCHHVAYLYAYSNKPWQGQSYIHKIIRDFYQATPDGMLGNDDCGQMSAWYILSCMGFYPINPASGDFVMGSPQFKHIILHLTSDKILEITANGITENKYCVERATINGMPVNKTICYHDIMNGGKLVFYMKEESSKMNVKYKALKTGAVKPSGWIRAQMQKDMEGAFGHLDKLAPTLFEEDIYGLERLSLTSKAKQLGNNKDGDAEGEEQYKWWNSETQSNWHDGYIRNAFLLNDSTGMAASRAYINNILATQDSDGYLGIYTPELRFHFNKENGELWSKTTLCRALLGYYECTGDNNVLNVVRKCADNVMSNWPVDTSHPFFAGNDYNGGTAHGLTFTDVLEKLSSITGEQKYLDYACFLYRDYSSNFSSENDAQLTNALNADIRLRCHGVHTYEHIRAMLISASQTGGKYDNALNRYLQKVKLSTTVTGGAIGDEWIAGRYADATNTGYEYCSLQELMDSYIHLLQYRGSAEIAERIENIFLNAAQGARHPLKTEIAYLKTDNSYQMMGTRNGEVETGRNQTRYKYSSVHQDVAVCCVPNALRISPYFVQSAWMKDSIGDLTLQQLTPSCVKAVIEGKVVELSINTEYPSKLFFNIVIKRNGLPTLRFNVRKPSWVTDIVASMPYTEKDGYITFVITDKQKDFVNISFKTTPRVITDIKGKHYFAYGAQIYALPIAAKEIKGKQYADGVYDSMYKPLTDIHYTYIPNANPVYENGTLTVSLKNNDTSEIERLLLVPISKTILRQAAF
jgi:predicted alpha-1,2-mannosidase